MLMEKSRLLNLNLIKMKNIDKIRILIVLFCCIFLSGCDEENESLDTDKVRAIGTYELENVDKNIWGDFQLVLEIDKDKYLYEDKILTNLRFKNIGQKAIMLNLVISETQMNNPPNINIWSANGRKYKVLELVKELSDSIYIEPKESVNLMQFDLTDVGGIIYRKDTTGGYIGYKGFEYSNIGSEFTKDTYYMTAAFFPVPQIYGCMTDTLSFEIK